MADQRSSSSFSFTYDVFLSFHGEDTGSGFTDHLLKALRDRGIHTFLEDKELPKGDETTTTIVKAIEESRIAIIVFSQNYAASSFCLEELASIVDNFQRNHRLIVPVFYGVDPSDVRHQRGTYGEALEMHEEKFKDNNQKVQKWRNSLRQVGGLAGWFFRHGDGYDFLFIKRIVEEVSRKINRVPLHVVDYLVGLESQLEEVQSLLELESNDVLMVGIHGVGGIGKSTLARLLYNSIADQFEGLCFLDGVRENSNIHGLVHLQNMLLSEIIGEKGIQLGSANKGASIIKERLHRTKVLLILDDVNTLEQLEALVGVSDSFGPGSRVIITARDKHLLAFHGVERTYEVQALNHQDSLQLLSHQVFKQRNFDPRHTEILNELVSYASGLPFPLKVIGSYLFGKSEHQWTDALHRFKRIPPGEIQMTHKTRFDALREDEKSVFLDIACCFKGYELTDVRDVLCGHYGHNMEYQIQVLIEKSLISVSLDGKVTLEPLIEGMGKEIVRQESPTNPGERSRLWNHEDIVQVLEENTGTSKTEIVHLDSPLSEVIEWDGEAFKKMKNLKTLIIRKWHFSRAPEHLPSSLRVLEWWEYPSPALPSNFDPTKVYMCRISHRDPEVPPISQGVTEVSQSVPPPQALDIVPYVSPNSQNVPEVQISHRDPEVPPISQGVTEVSQSVPPPQTSDIVSYVSPNSQNVPEVQISHRDPEVSPISQGVTEVSESVPPPYVSRNSQNVPEVLQTSQRVTQAMLQISLGALQILQGVFRRVFCRHQQNSQRITRAMLQILQGALQILQGVFRRVFCRLQQTYQRVARAMLQISQGALQILQGVFQADLTWRLVGLMSNAVGLPCYALSPSFTCLIGGWNYVKSILYFVFFLVIQATIYYGKQSSLFNKPPWLKKLVKFVFFMLLSVYSTRYDKCLDGKPEILSMVSNAVLALVSLSLSRLINLGGEKGIFSYFLGCFAVQLYTIDWWLIFVVIFFGFPLFVMHSSSDSQPEADHRRQVNDSSSDSRPDVGSGGGDQHVVDIHT